jgi:hypothetical protein
LNAAFHPINDKLPMPSGGTSFRDGEAAGFKQKTKLPDHIQDYIQTDFT